MPILSELIESDVDDSQDVLNSILSSPSAVPTPQEPKKKAPARKQQKSQKATKPKAEPRAAAKSNTAKAAAAAKRAATKKATAAKRKAVEEPTDDGEDGDDAGDVPELQQPNPRGRGTAAKTGGNTVSYDPIDGMGDAPLPPAAGTSQPSASLPAKAASRPAKRAKTSAKKPVKKTALNTGTGEDADTDADAKAGAEAEAEAAEEQDVLSEPEETSQQEPARPRNASRQTSRIRQQPVVRRRAGSASDTERVDPALRRKLGDITRKFENVDLKYRNLKEVGIAEANANMEKLRQRCEASTLASNELIASLKRELATQAPLVRNAQKIKSQLHSQEVEVVKLRTTAAELAGSLAAAQNEIKALQAKLAAARASSAAAESRTPARESKRDSRPPPVPASEALQIAQMKEELYSDLTGLIVRSVKRGADGDTYDCIQTGRNGTLHFKLFVDAEDAKNASFEETDFLYTPLLDANRDRDMIELMPSYLTEEITFARQNAAKFYGRVLDTLTKRRADE